MRIRIFSLSTNIDKSSITVISWGMIKLDIKWRMAYTVTIKIVIRLSTISVPFCCEPWGPPQGLVYVKERPERASPHLGFGPLPEPYPSSGCDMMSSR